MKTYPPLLQQVLDETAAERQRITEEVKNKYQNEELKELVRKLRIDLLEIEEQLFSHPDRDVGNTKVHYAWHKAKAAIAKADDKLSKIK